MHASVIIITGFRSVGLDGNTTSLLISPSAKGALLWFLRRSYRSLEALQGTWKDLELELRLGKTFSRPKWDSDLHSVLRRPTQVPVLDCDKILVGVVHLSSAPTLPARQNLVGWLFYCSKS